MTKLETGGTAISCMTLLDYFAGQAMTGELASQGNNEDIAEYDHKDPSTNSCTPEFLARRSYIFAQAMLTEKRRLEAEAKELPKVG